MRTDDDIVTRLGVPLADRWWLFIVRGLLAIAFGILALVEPPAALWAVVMLFGIWALVDGIDALAMAFGRRRSWQLVVIGFLGIAAGLITLFRPGITALGLYALIAGWAIARGIVEIVLAIELRREIRGEGWMIVAGVSSTFFGILLIALPAAGVVALIWLIAFYAFWFGAMMLLVGFRLREHRPRKTPMVTTPQPA
jgi:uncharacterized membrane protein HdeD (DUF308 family)